MNFWMTNCLAIYNPSSTIVVVILMFLKEVSELWSNYI